jgi:hypothetical protein
VWWGWNQQTGTTRAKDLAGGGEGYEDCVPERRGGGKGEVIVGCEINLGVCGGCWFWKTTTDETLVAGF